MEYEHSAIRADLLFKTSLDGVAGTFHGRIVVYSSRHPEAPAIRLTCTEPTKELCEAFFEQVKKEAEAESWDDFIYKNTRYVP